MRCAEKVAAAYRQGHRDGYESAREDGWMEQGRATADALDAAREAVAALPFDPLNRDQGPAATQRQAIAAIDALREES